MRESSQNRMCCPSGTACFAAGHVGELMGVPVQELAIDIHNRHRADKSCTHLNDMVRFLGEVPAVAQHLLEAVLRADL